MHRGGLKARSTNPGYSPRHHHEAYHPRHHGGHHARPPRPARPLLALAVVFGLAGIALLLPGGSRSGAQDALGLARPALAAAAAPAPLFRGEALIPPLPPDRIKPDPQHRLRDALRSAAAEAAADARAEARQDAAQAAAAAAAASRQAQAPAVPQQPAQSPAAATPAAASYAGPPGSFQSCVIAHESGGNPAAYNPSSGAGGLYQFLPSTWASLGYAASYPGGAQTAPVSVQNAAFAALYAEAGTAPWAGDGCV